MSKFKVRKAFWMQEMGGGGGGVNGPLIVWAGEKLLRW